MYFRKLVFISPNVPFNFFDKTISSVLLQNAAAHSKCMESQLAEILEQL